MRYVFCILPLIFASLMASAQDFVPGEIIVKLKGKANSSTTQAFMGKAVGQKGMVLKGSWSGLNMHQFSLKGNAGVEATVDSLMQDPDVEYAEPNYYIRMHNYQVSGQAMSMADFHASSVSAQAASFTQSTAAIDIPNAWTAMSVAGSTVIVAVIDTGIDYNHTVFSGSGAVWNNAGETPNDGIDNDGNGYVDDWRGWNFVANNNNPYDDEGHGTHVSGIVLGTTQDIRQNPIQPAKIKIMPLKFLDSTGTGTTSSAVQAIYYAVNNGAHVLNNSWGGGGYSNSLIDAVTYSYEARRVFVAAAGNLASNNDAVPTYPASYSVPNIISVAATSDVDVLAGFSNYGAHSVHLASPGVDILSTMPFNTLRRASGTSMATPFISGLAALMLREEPTMNGYQIKNLIFQSSDVVAGLNQKVSTRARMNAAGAVVLAKSTAADGFQPSYSASHVAEREPAGGKAGGCGMVTYQMLKGGGGDGGSGSAPMRSLMFFAIMALVMAPICFAAYMRNKAGANRRKFVRYQIESQVRLQIGDQELQGSVSTISVGGAQLNMDAALVKGGVVTMTISSPDGKDQVQVQGRIVWAAEQKRYGVQFADVQESVQTTIGRWTQTLLKA